MTFENSPPSEDRAEPFRVDGRLVDPAACRVTWAGKDTHIEPKAMQVLTYLVRRRRQVVSRQELEDWVWEDTVVGPKAVTNTIIKLRKALGDDARHPRIIETIPKRGYRLLSEVNPTATENQAGSRQSTPACGSDDDGKAIGTTALRADSAQSTPGAAPTTGRHRSRQRTTPVARWVLVAASVVLICAGGLLAWHQFSAPELEPVSPEAMMLPLPDKPSLVVLPFDNLSGGPEQDYLANGMTDTLISVLSQIPQLFVISRNSAFTYKDQPVRVRRVSEELGIRYVLEGSIQRSGDRVRITAQLIDAVKGYHIWSERYDRKLADLFALQDEIALKTVVSLQVQLTMGEQARVLSRTTENVEAWIYYTQALSEFLKFGRAGIANARQLANKALSLDPDFADAMVILGFTHLIDARHGYSSSSEESLRLAIELSTNAKALAPQMPMLYNLEQSILRFQGKLDKAVRAGERAIELSPNMSISLLATAMTMHFAGQFEHAAGLARQAMRHNPHYSSANLIWVGWSSWFTGDNEQAISAAQEGLRRAEDPALKGVHHLTLALAYTDKGEPDEARQALADARRAFPRFSIDYFKKGFPYRNKLHQERLLRTLRQAGLPESINQ